MTIVLDGRHIQDRFPGIGRYVFNLASSLARVTVDDKLRLVLNPSLSNTRFDLSTLYSSGSIEIVEVGAKTWSVGEQFLGMDARLVRNASLWHSPYYLMPYLIPLPSVVTLEDILPMIVRQSMPSAVSRLIYRVLNVLAAKRAAHIITLSNATAADLRRILGAPGSKITVIPLAADPDFHPRGAEEITRMREKLGLRGKYALYVGSNKPHKNLVRLIEAWSRANPDAILVIAGHWDPRFPEAKQVLQDLSLGGRVIFRENLSADEVPVLMSGAEVFVFPSLYEGFGLPPLEAMASGTPVVCSNASGLAEVVGEAALLFDPLDVQDIASNLSRVLKDKGLADSLRGQGLARAACFSWDETARETMHVYEAVASGRRSRINGQGAAGGSAGADK